MMHQSKFQAASVALSRAADKRKSLINIHKNQYTATLSYDASFLNIHLATISKQPVIVITTDNTSNFVTTKVQRATTLTTKHLWGHN